jgi:hypothetical protein
MSSLSEQIRQRVRQKAKSRCEYCLSHQDYVMGRLQIDHTAVSRFMRDNNSSEQTSCEDDWDPSSSLLS